MIRLKKRCANTIQNISNILYYRGIYHIEEIAGTAAEIFSDVRQSCLNTFASSEPKPGLSVYTELPGPHYLNFIVSIKPFIICSEFS